MRHPPTPPDAVPGFIVDRFADHSPEELRAISEYAETQTPSEDESTVPDYVVKAFAIQDDETVAAIAIYADELAEHLEQGTDEEPEGDVDDDDDDDDSPPIRGGSFFG